MYEDCGSGFSEEKSYRVSEVKQLGKEITFTLTVRKEIRRLRIDPGNQPTFVVLKSARLNGDDILASVMKKEAFSRDTNGKKIGDDGYMFITQDPHFTFKVPAFEGETAKLTMTMLLSQIPEEIAGRL